MTTFKKVAGIAVLALVLAACSTGNAYDSRYERGDRTFKGAQSK